MTPNFLGIPQLSVTVSDPGAINADTKTQGSIVTANGYGSEINSEGLFSGHIDLKWAGNSSLAAPKKSYNLTTLTAANANNDVPFLSLPSGRDWRLSADAYDQSGLKNHFAFRLGRQLSNIPWTPKTRPVELFINTVYQGTYILVERVKRHINRIKAAGSTGLLMEITLDAQIAVGDPFFSTPLLQAFTTPQFDFGVPSSYVPDVPTSYNSLSDVAKAALTAEMTALDDAIVAHDWDEVFAFFDFDALVDWYLLQEFVKNWDSPRLGSTRLIRDSVLLSGRAWLGFWDFDMSLGLSFDPPFDNLDDWAPAEGLWAGLGNWFAHIIQCEPFMDAVKARFVELLPMLYREIDTLEANADFMESSGAYGRNFAKWGKINFNSSEPIYDTPLEAAQGALSFIEDRMTWLRGQWEAPVVPTKQSITI